MGSSTEHHGLSPQPLCSHPSCPQPLPPHGSLAILPQAPQPVPSPTASCSPLIALLLGHPCQDIPCPGVPSSPQRIPGLLPMWQLCTQMRCPSYLQLHFMALLVKSLSATSKLGLITTCGALSVRVAAPCPTPGSAAALCCVSLAFAASVELLPVAWPPAPQPCQDQSPQLHWDMLEGSEEPVAAAVVGAALSLCTMCPRAVLLRAGKPGLKHARAVPA